MSKDKQISWNNIDYETKVGIDNLLESDLSEELKIKGLVTLIFDIDLNDIPINKLDYYISQLNFLSEKIPTREIQKFYTINGHNYKLFRDINKLTSGQYLDYQNYLKQPQIEYNKLLSVLLIPDGKKYLDGYDIEEVHEDLLHINVIDLNSISNFLLRQSLKFIKHSVNYSILKIWRTKGLTLKQKARLTNLAEKATNLMELSITS